MTWVAKSSGLQNCSRVVRAPRCFVRVHGLGYVMGPLDWPVGASGTGLYEGNGHGRCGVCLDDGHVGRQLAINLDGLELDRINAGRSRDTVTNDKKIPALTPWTESWGHIVWNENLYSLPLTVLEPIDLAWGHIWQISDRCGLELDVDFGENVYRRASLINLYVHTEFHQDQTKKMWTDGRTSSPVL